jgi:hypothetical protein
VENGDNLSPKTVDKSIHFNYICAPAEENLIPLSFYACVKKKIARHIFPIAMEGVENLSPFFVENIYHGDI